MTPDSTQAAPERGRPALGPTSLDFESDPQRRMTSPSRVRALAAAAAHQSAGRRCHVRCWHQGEHGWFVVCDETYERLWSLNHSPDHEALHSPRKITVSKDKAQICDEIGKKISRKIFERGGNRSEIHLTEESLANIIEGAAHHTLDITHRGFEAQNAAQHYQVQYRGHVIGLKRDFGFQFVLLDGMPCMWGYVVTYGADHEYAGCNSMPGAVWFQTVRDAKHAIDVLVEVGPDNAAAFWERLKSGDKDEEIARLKKRLASISSIANGEEHISPDAPGISGSRTAAPAPARKVSPI